ncbi:TPA: type IV conjugative transfer system protein TraL [Aeromonas veronii]
MSSEALDKYRFPKTLSEQRRLLGLPYDEGIPAALPLAWGIYVGNPMFGLCAGALIWFSIRTAKRGRGSMWLYNLLYWYFPTVLFRSVFKVIPDSSFRQWIK